MPNPLNANDLERIDGILNNPTRYDKAALLGAAKRLRAEVERQREVIADYDFDHWTPGGEG